ncbi:hypothetical protein K488DRAFT_87922 [Vararia minispora EC-137]|uniref:Uncharacterized protein n=1 Tax=Vararia minispora EC-137 TaxID=1314806 RepID=A0ACB8QF34_9AGAM|nr:hypothetical protein K488DRAFT_87922 [Vararia minispora EC-137]
MSFISLAQEASAISSDELEYALSEGLLYTPAGSDLARIRNVLKKQGELCKLKFNLPQRRSGNIEIPMEIYLYLFQHFEASSPQKRDYTSLSSVCRLFHAISVTLRLRNITFSNKSHHEGIWLTKFMDGIVLYPYSFYHLSALVREITINWEHYREPEYDFQNPMITSSPDSWNRFPTRYLASLALFRNVYRINFNLTVSYELLAGLAGLPSLQNVTFEICEAFEAFPAGVDPGAMRRPTRSWEKLRVSWLGSTTSDAFADALAALAGWPSLDTLRLERVPFARRFFSHSAGRLTGLVRLAAPAPENAADATTLKELLVAAPKIKSLSFHGAFDINTGPPPPSSALRLPADALPQLCSVSGSSDILAVLIPGRPVDTADATSYYMPLRPEWGFEHEMPWAWASDRGLRCLAASTAGLTTLTIGVDALAHGRIDSLPLERLTLLYEHIGVGHLQYLLGQDSADAVPVHASVRTVRIGVREFGTVRGGPYSAMHAPGAFNLVLQRDYITDALARAFPGATGFVFCTAIVWCKNSNGDWTPCVLDQRAVYDALRGTSSQELRSLENIRDWGGCLHRLLAAGHNLGW